jgi:hypothetical protein
LNTTAAAPPGADPTPAQMQRHLRRANELARAAMADGHHPFGALLVDADGETVLLEQRNVDSVDHAEAVLARAAAHQFAAQRLGGARWSPLSSLARCAPARSTGRTSASWSTA